MANKFTTGNSFSTGDQVTAAKLNALINSATFNTGAVDDATTEISSGAIIVKDAGITDAKLATNSVITAKITDSNVTTAKIADSNVTKAKIENLANMKALGNVSGSAAAPAEVAILDEDNMASNSATSLATQQSIKAYADSKVDGTGAGSFTTLAASGDVTFDTTTLKVDSSNNRVGIGTASPSEELEVSANGVGLLVRNSDANQEAGIATVRGQRSDANTSPAAAGGMSLESWNTSGATVVDEHLGSVYFGANHTSGSESNILGTASIAGIAEGTFSNSSTMPSGIAFRTGSAGQAIGVYNHHVGEVERMRIDSSGNVGIGTATPTHKFHVVGEARFGDGGSVNDDLILKGSEPAAVAPGGSVSGAIITTNGTGSASGHIGVEVPANDADDGFFVATDANLDGTVDKIALKIKANGNVGIGETAPTAPLTVTSTTGGVLLPRMTTTQMNAISSPANGEMIYNTTANKFYGYASGAWVALH